ncbi:threonine aldolase, partial [Candidatus Gastranaerophilus sp. (ex Termes propinquus)]
MTSFKYSFKNDYSELAHPRLLAALSEVGIGQFEEYGLDAHCAQAAGLIREKIRAKEADVHFLSGGTQCNLTVIS